MHSFHLLTLLTFAVSQAASYKLSFYRGEGCRGEMLGEIVAGPGVGCRKDNAGFAQSVIIESTGEVDDNFMFNFMTGADCNPDTAYAKSDGTIGKCLTATVDDKNFAAWQIWNVYE
ncbi:hypothetical protein BJ875DRAFT_398443 [Amylocarpus encephaloides]|uniref:Uncharacterized protein n=1 Tax=Amylocarpus encephaloides TaxID=45428 RepID=A0A9P7YLH0_9HELO|nr:hypothetical protein BJ875DRAFT_398443 [Amylocarpus encephaloides]